MRFLLSFPTEIMIWLASTLRYIKEGEAGHIIIDHNNSNNSNMYNVIHIYIYIYVYLRNACVYIYIYTHVCIYIYIHTQILRLPPVPTRAAGPASSKMKLLSGRASSRALSDSDSAVADFKASPRRCWVHSGACVCETVRGHR